MAKLMTMFMILIAVQATLILYQNTNPDDTGNDIWDFVWNMDQWGSLQFIIGLSAIALAIGLTGISSGSIFGFKTDFLVMGPAIGGLISIGVVFVNLGKVLRDELVAQFACSSPSACAPASWIISITIGPLALYYVWTVIEWWRGKDL